MPQSCIPRALRRSHSRLPLSFLLSGHARRPPRRRRGDATRRRAMSAAAFGACDRDRRLASTTCSRRACRRTSRQSSLHAADPFAAFVAEASQRFGIPAAGFAPSCSVESFGDVRAMSPKGAMGLMQIMPETWAGLRARYGLGADPYDPARQHHGRRGLSARAATIAMASPGFLAAYNAGPARYEDHLATGRPLPAETRAYVATLAPIVGGSDDRRHGHRRPPSCNPGPRRRCFVSALRRASAERTRLSADAAIGAADRPTVQRRIGPASRRNPTDCSSLISHRERPP